KKAAEHATGMQRPSREQLGQLVQAGKRTSPRFADDGLVPNHPRWPLILYRRAVKLPRSLDPAAVFEELFEANDWGDTWRGEIYDYLHYHSKIHEVLGIARGNATVRLGGDKGKIVPLKAGDVVILPAGTGHQSLSASKTFMAVGAYPSSGTYNLCKPTP